MKKIFLFFFFSLCTISYSSQAAIWQPLEADNKNYNGAHSSEPVFQTDLAELRQNVVVMDPKKSQFDIGHLFSTGSGGLASVKVACGYYKARGRTFDNKSEPGSGSTIMSYPSFCGGENICYRELMFAVVIFSSLFQTIT